MKICILGERYIRLTTKTYTWIQIIHVHTMKDKIYAFKYVYGENLWTVDKCQIYYMEDHWNYKTIRRNERQ